jgi:hypothetical protein
MSIENDRRELIESKIDKERSASILLYSGGVDLANLAQAFEIAKAMSTAGPCIPAYLQNNPGSCLYHIMRGIRWRLDPFAIAEDSYVVENKKTKELRIAYGSRTIHAAIERNAPIQKRLASSYLGEGGTRVCVVQGLFLDGEVREYKSPPLEAILKRRRQPDETGAGGAGSPLWWFDPDQQLHYFATRAWSRRWCPDVLLGAYTREEMLEEGGFEEKAIKPPNGGEPPEDGGLSERLSAAALRSAGFSPSFAAQTIDERAVAGDNTASPASRVAPVEAEVGGGESGSPPPPTSPPTDGQGQAPEDAAATPAAETAEGRPRGSQRRPRPAKPEGDDARLV